jgi:hypothetical protein
MFLAGNVLRTLMKGIMRAKAKFVLAILSVAFLILNPIGACASISVTSPPSSLLPKGADCARTRGRLRV